MSGIFDANNQDSALFIGGTRVSGQQVRSQNVMAAQSIANVIKTSLGPVGLDKMLVDDVGDVTISNDGATILQLLEVEHPAGKILVKLAQQQDTEVGDGTTSVVVIAAELLRRANELVKSHIHPATVIAGYRLACKEANRFIADQMAQKVDTLGAEALVNVAMTTISSKILGTYGTFFAEMAVDALKAVRSQDGRGKARYAVGAVNILKVKGSSARESSWFTGHALYRPFTGAAMRRSVTSPCIAVIDFDITKTRMKLGVHIVIDNPDSLEAIRKREADISAERVRMLLDAGVTAVFSTRGIDDVYVKMFAEAGAVTVTRVPKDDARRIARGCGASVLTTLATLDGDEAVDVSALGSAELVEQVRLSDDDVVVVRGAREQHAATVILRGANDYMLDEMERSFHDSLCAVKRVLESGSVVPGGGAVEVALDIYLESFATTLGSREQLAIVEFANALLSIPKQLAVNAAKDSIELVAKLRAYHAAAQNAAPDAPRSHLKHYGLDLHEGKLRDNVKAGVLEPAMSKIKMLKSATEAAINILRIDDMIKLVPEQQAEDPHAHM
ncbi:chaperonin-containing T-complex alpha subunit Cct1 [Coemansia sp. RSA 1822]|nr:chaperonin-containing T-complex alpha subunit Cct1 [Coemansia sp. RSA 638]KAJ2124955.1 chaperonin-containing T-complex alpha subunit Cct1 [Coemansia sp. RSA 720]KAJ2544858.1 chaperonin-containing T-complex alpha subunit Cct1 [Coemansia sp. RSA 1853]KAJ2565707.1 chaperonin-containing T-complex alpha subunit Cct1 [Coemansia sp. RSA 1822]